MGRMEAQLMTGLLRRRLGIALSALCLVGAAARADAGPEWILPETPDRLYWGSKGGLLFTVWPGSLHQSRRGLGGPRGLIRVGYEKDGRHVMVNFIAVEPVVTGPRGYSELERSQLDQVQGKRFWPVHPLLGPNVEPDEPTFRHEHTRIHRHPDGHEVLEVGVGVEPFQNGARPFLILRIDGRRLHELALEVHAASGSAEMRQCVLTATMGNYIRARRLWLAGEVVESSRLYGDYTGNGFAAPTTYRREDLLLRDGYRWAAITTDEADPASVRPMPGGGWQYQGEPVTQYWRAADDLPDEPLWARVNARYAYWASTTPIPGGVSYENFELIRPFRPGQIFIFGITHETPEELTFPAGSHP